MRRPLCVIVALWTISALTVPSAAQAGRMESTFLILQFEDVVSYSWVDRNRLNIRVVDHGHYQNGFATAVCAILKHANVDLNVIVYVSDYAQFRYMKRDIYFETVHCAVALLIEPILKTPTSR